jgi:hypothetical protein
MQAPPLHWYVPHSWTPCGRQVPRPLHVPAVFSRLPLQVAGRQTVSVAYLAQPPMPSQLPVWPQVDLAAWVQILWGSGAFTAVGSQDPKRPA